MKGATGVLINITGGYDMTLYEVDEAANEIRSEVDPEANIIVGSTFDETMEGSMRVSVVATGIDAEADVAADPRSRQRIGAASDRSSPNDAILPWKRTGSDRPGRIAPASGERGISRSEPVARASESTASRSQPQPEPESEPEAVAEPLKRAVGAEDLSDAVADTQIERDNDPYLAEARTTTETGTEAQQPQVLRDQARLAEEAANLNMRYEQRRNATQQPAVETDDEPRRGFSLFGRRRRPTEPAPKRPRR